MSELDRLNGIAERESNTIGFNGKLIKYRHMAMLPHIGKLGTRKLVYDVGAGEGANTPFLVQHFERVISIEPAKTYFNQLRSDSAVNATIDEYVESTPAPELADCVISTCVLEHVPDPAAFIACAYRLLKPGGLLLIVVPNAGSLHRRHGKHIGVIADLQELQDHDHAFGHLRYYTQYTLKECFNPTPEIYGIMLKPFPNFQMDILSNDAIDALYIESQILPACYAAEIIAVAIKD